MKRTVVIVVLLAAGFVGGASSRPAMRWPWAGEAYNQLCGKTWLEWRCLEQRINPRPVPLTPTWQLDTLLAEPRPRGLLVKANVSLKAGARAKPNDPRYIEQRAKAEREVCRYVNDHLYRALPPLPPAPASIQPPPDAPPPFLDYADSRLEIYCQGVFVKAFGMSAERLRP